MRCTPASTIQGLFAAWRIGDIDTVLAYCTPDIRYAVHSADGRYDFGVAAIGAEDVRAYLTAICSSWEFLQIEPGPLTISDDIVREYSYFRSRHRKSGLVLEGGRRHVWVLRDNRVASCSEYQDVSTLMAFMQLVDARGRGFARAAIGPLVHCSAMAAGLAGIV